MEYPFLILGFMLLIKGADFFVAGSGAVARLLKIPSVVIGLTIVAMGTSAPEASVSITAGLSGSNDIALGNILGSNLFNLLFIVGICALIKTSSADREIVRRDLPVSIGAAMLVILASTDGVLSLYEGLAMIALMIAYLSALTVSAVKSDKCPFTRDRLGAAALGPDRPEPAPPLPVGRRATALCWSKNLLYIAGGLTAVIFGGQFVVDCAVKIAGDLGLSESLIGLTVVAIGTSLPELVTSIAAAKKGDSGLALGNVVGSNIFNILFILGASAALHPITVATESLIDAGILLIVSLLAFLLYAFGNKSNRFLGIGFIALYVAYTAYIIL